MRTSKATRTSLTEAIIFNDADQPFSRINWPAAKIWRTEQAPLSDNLPECVQTDLTMTVEGRNFTIRRKLLTNKFFWNDFTVSMFDEQNNLVSVAHIPGFGRRIHIEQDGKTYALKRNGWFNFDFTLVEDGQTIAHFIETTPFLTLSSKREFAIVSRDVPTAATLISFSFFLAHNWFF
ncbi:MAG: hypothetical protein LZF86_120019 [Nitrospira sp.]|nr:MAG: hypothetical protein LZF86_120019 [Nitrospira sp.]